MRQRRAPRSNPLSFQKDPRGRRERVLSAAEQLFARSGYGGVTTAQIASAAGVAEGNVFHYFGSKQKLLCEVGARWGRGFAAAMFEGARPRAGRDVIETMVRRAFAYVESSHAGFGLFLLSSDPALGREVYLANRRAVTSAVENAIVQWSHLRLVRVGNPGIVANLLFGLVEAALRACFVEGDGEGPPASRQAVAAYRDEVVTAIVRILEIDA